MAEHPIYSISLYILLKSPSLWLVDFLNIIKTVLYIGNVLPLQWAQLTKTVHTARLDLEFDFLCFLGCTIYLGLVRHFPSCFCAGVTNLNEPPSSFLLPPHYCGLGAGSVLLGPLRTQSNAIRGVIYVAGYPLLNRRCTIYRNRNRSWRHGSVVRTSVCG